MGQDLLYGLGLGAYMLVMILVGYLVKDRIKTSEDYLVAGRSFGLFFNSATLVACFIGGSPLSFSVPKHGNRGYCLRRRGGRAEALALSRGKTRLSACVTRLFPSLL